MSQQRVEGGSHWVGIGRMVRIGILRLCNKIPYSVGWRKDGSSFGTSHNMHHNKGWKVGHWVGTNGRDQHHWLRSETDNKTSKDGGWVEVGNGREHMHQNQII